MKLYLVTDWGGWGSSTNIVRANSIEEAKRFVAHESENMRAEELQIDGHPGIIWEECYDNDE